MTRAFVRTVSRSLANCELLHVPRQAFDLSIARKQHDAYVAALETAGLKVTILPEQAEGPDATFVEDTVVVLDELAVICRLGCTSREPEAALMEREIAAFRPVRRISLPGSLEGGDVLRIGRMIFVGLSSRTNDEGIRQLRDFVSPLGYTVTAVPVNQCLHLKTGVTSLGKGRVVLNSRWIDAVAFRDFEVLELPENEPWGANTLAVNDTVFVNHSAPRTAELLKSKGLDVQSIDISELQKAEAGLTCLSVLF